MKLNLYSAGHVTLLCVIAASCSAQYSTASQLEAARAMERQRIAIEALKAQQYDLREPTSSEIAEMERQWKEKNPFKPTHAMPDFSKRKIRVEKAGAIKQQMAETEMRLQQLEAAQQQRSDRGSSQHQPKGDRALKKGANQKAQNVSTQSTAPRPAANSTSVLMRKLSDGRCVVIAGGETRYFANEAEAKAYLANVR